jgi:hypothetical protein
MYKGYRNYERFKKTKGGQQYIFQAKNGVGASIVRFGAKKFCLMKRSLVKMPFEILSVSHKFMNHEKNNAFSCMLCGGARFRRTIGVFRPPTRHDLYSAGRRKRL